MLNQVTIVGRLVKNPQLEQIGDSEFAKITIACPRSYKNSEGVYETDFIDVTLTNVIAESTVEYCRKGDLIGIKGRLETENVATGVGMYGRKMKLVVEKLTFLSSANANSNRNCNENCNNNDLERGEI